jgi:hypothetical protein
MTGGRCVGDSANNTVVSDLGGYSQHEIELTEATLRRTIEIEELELEHWSRSLDAHVVELAS